MADKSQTQALNVAEIMRRLSRLEQLMEAIARDIGGPRAKRILDGSRAGTSG